MPRLAELRWTSKIRLPDEWFVMQFFQRQVDRIIQGHARYGTPHRRKRYMTRLIKEVEAYHKTGNAEHLYNAANYCHLEAMCPEHPDFHEDSKAKSVTRGKI